VQRREFEPVERESVERAGPGEAVEEFEPGDFILTHGNAWTSRLIRFGQRLRIHGDDRRFTHWNHAAIIVSSGGDLVEALGRGVLRTHLSSYEGTEYHLVRIGAETRDREQAVAFADWAAGGADAGDRLRYGFATIASIAFALLTGAKFTFGIEGQAICSGLVARAMERTDAIFNRTSTHIMPADLAKYYGVEPPKG
jgi:uncharacterized protein YycO